MSLTKGQSKRLRAPAPAQKTLTGGMFIWIGYIQIRFYCPTCNHDVEADRDRIVGHAVGKWFNRGLMRSANACGESMRAKLLIPRKT